MEMAGHSLAYITSLAIRHDYNIKKRQLFMVPIKRHRLQIFFISMVLLKFLYLLGSIGRVNYMMP
jgi:hypothetical protein